MPTQICVDRPDIEMIREEAWRLGGQLLSCQIREALNDRQYEMELSLSPIALFGVQWG